MSRLTSIILVAVFAGAGCSARHPRGTAIAVGFNNRPIGTVQRVSPPPAQETRRPTGVAPAARRGGTAASSASDVATAATIGQDGARQPQAAGTTGRNEAEAALAPDSTADRAPVSPSPSARPASAEPHAAPVETPESGKEHSVAAPVSIALLTVVAIVALRRFW